MGGVQVNVLTVKLNTAETFRAPTAEYRWMAFIYVCQCMKYLLLWKRVCVLVRIWAHDFVKMNFYMKEVRGFSFSESYFLLAFWLLHINSCQIEIFKTIQRPSHPVAWAHHT